MPDPMRRWRKACNRDALDRYGFENIYLRNGGGIKKHTAIVFASPVSLQLQDSVNARESPLSLGQRNESGMSLQPTGIRLQVVESLEFLISNPNKFSGSKISVS